MGCCAEQGSKRRAKVNENLRMGAYTRTDNAGIQQDLEMILALFPRLKEET